MRALVTYDKGNRSFIYGETWADLMDEIGCNALSVVIIDPVDDEDAVKRNFEAAEKAALAVVEEKARRILGRQKHLDEFVMGMGTYFFTTKKGETVDDDLDNTPKWLEGLANFIDEWDGALHLTGTSMRFTRYGPVVTEW